MESSEAFNLSVLQFSQLHMRKYGSQMFYGKMTNQLGEKHIVFQVIKVQILVKSFYFCLINHMPLQTAAFISEPVHSSAPTRHAQ